MNDFSTKIILKYFQENKGILKMFLYNITRQVPVASELFKNNDFTPGGVQLVLDPLGVFYYDKNLQTTARD